MAGGPCALKHEKIMAGGLSAVEHEKIRIAQSEQAKQAKATKCEQEEKAEPPPLRRLYIDPSIVEDEHHVLLMQYVCKTARNCSRSKRSQGPSRAK